MLAFRHGSTSSTRLIQVASALAMLVGGFEAATRGPTSGLLFTLLVLAALLLGGSPRARRLPGFPDPARVLLVVAAGTQGPLGLIALTLVRAAARRLGPEGSRARGLQAEGLASLVVAVLSVLPVPEDAPRALALACLWRLLTALGDFIASHRRGRDATTESGPDMDGPLAGWAELPLGLALTLLVFAPSREADLIETLPPVVATLLCLVALHLLGLGLARLGRELRYEAQERQRATRQQIEMTRALMGGMNAMMGREVAAPGRVAALAGCLGRLTGQDESRVQEIELSALLREAGLLVPLPDALSDPRSTPVSRASGESAAARALLAETGLSNRVLEGIHSRHERWDGTGGPRRLDGERIPLYGRLLAVAEALESAFSSLDRGETAIAARLVAESGSRLDPRLCAIAIERLPRLTEAWKGSRVRRASDPARLLEEARVRQKTLRAERLKAVARRVDLLLAGASTLDEHLLVLVREEIAALVPLRHLALYALDGETAGPRVMLSTGLGDAAVRAVHEASSDSTVHVAGARVSTLPDGGVHLLLLADPDTDAEILDWLSETLARLLNGPLSGVHAPDSNLRASRTDPLTGLADAVALREALDGTLESAAVDHAPLTLVLVDMEGLPRLNTRHGRSVGDQALRALARVLVSTLRVKDLSARLGGAHFAALLEGCDALDAANVAARLREAVRGTTIILPDGFLESLEVRLGTASWPADGEGADELVERARERVLDEVEPLEESSLEQVA